MHYISQFVKDKSLRRSNKVLSATNEFKITQIVDNGQMIQLTLIENVSTEPISQKQMIIENVSKKLDSETKEQVMPLLEAILQAQPTVNILSLQENISKLKLQFLFVRIFLVLYHYIQLMRLIHTFRFFSNPPQLYFQLEAFPYCYILLLAL